MEPALSALPWGCETMNIWDILILVLLALALRWAFRAASGRTRGRCCGDCRDCSGCRKDRAEK